MFTKRELFSFFHNQSIRRFAKELLDHFLCFIVADHGCLGVFFKQADQRCRMVGLHVMHDHVVKIAAAKTVCHVFKEGLFHRAIHRIHQNGFLVQKKVGVVAHAARHRIHTLEHGKAAIIRPHPKKILGYFSYAMHISSSHSFRIILF